MMKPYVRSRVLAGISMLAATMIAIPPSVSLQTPTVAPTSETPPITLAASVQPLVLESPSPQRWAAAVAAIERIDPSARQTARQPEAVAVAPVPFNAASDLITSGYQFIQYFVDYGVQLTSYVLGFIPYGYLIAAQVNIVYFDLIRPISNSVVYDLINPVVNDPLNLSVYVNGLINVGRASVNALINTGISEFNYFFGWLIPPLPPLPLAVAKSAVEEQAATPTTKVEPADEEISPTDSVVEKRQVIAAEATEKSPEPTIEAGTTAPVVTEPASPATETIAEATATETEATEATTTSANGVQAQGEVRGAPEDRATTAAADTKDTNTKDTNAKDTKSEPPVAADAPADKTTETKKSADEESAEKG